MRLRYLDNFSNRKAEILNEVLQSARSLNDNGFLNCKNHLSKASILLKALIIDLKKEGIKV